MTSARQATVERLYGLLPSAYRVRDEQSGRPLRELLEVIAAEIDVLEENLDQFYDDLFVETSADWAVPYIGDLIGYRPLHGGPPAIASPRREVANTIAYRRRKGTAAMLEQLAFDVTRWPARAVEFFEYLATTQHMNHPRPNKGGAVESRHPAQLEWVGTAFDDCAHLVDVRRIGTGAGRYNIHNVGIFLWRIPAIEFTRSPLVPDNKSQRRFRFHPLGIDQPLFGKPRTEVEITHIAERFDVALPLTRRWLQAHLDTYYGDGRSLVIDAPGGAAPWKVRVCDLSDVTGDWAHAPQPGSGVVAIDPVLGRAYFPDPVPDGVTATATFYYGDALEIGGGGYDRAASVTVPVRAVTAGADLQTELNQVTGGGSVEIGDNWRYLQTPSISADAGQTVALCAASRRRPFITVDKPLTLTPDANGTVTLDGLLIGGGPLVLEAAADAEPRTIILKDCTLVPGRARTTANNPVTPDAASLIVSHPFARVDIARCILGPVVAVRGASVSIRDSVLDASTVDGVAYSGEAKDASVAGADLTLDECTVIGQAHAQRVEISNSIMLGTVTASRRQEGCVRFSYLPDASRTPPQYRCQPAGSTIRPEFTSLRFGDPGYAQLRASTADEIRRGASNESEMGAGNYLFAPQREANLRLRLDEYLRFGLEAGIFYAT